MRNLLDISKVQIRLVNIEKNATRVVSFNPSNGKENFDVTYSNSKLTPLEEINQNYPLQPQNYKLLENWEIFAYDESVQMYSALEGDLLFCSSAVIKISEEYEYNLTVLPFFFTSIKRLADEKIEGIQYSEDPILAKKMNMLAMKRSAILESVEPNSIVLIDGPLISGNIMAYTIKMDEELRNRGCIPIYFVKNSFSRMVIDYQEELAKNFNSDLHWAAKTLSENTRTALFRYVDQLNPRDSKVFTYFKQWMGFPLRIEMHSETFNKHADIISELFDLLSYLLLLQGDFRNPQVRPIVIAEKYAREGLKVLNIPVLLQRLGFHPTVNQVRFG